MRVHSSTALTKFSQEWLSCLARFAIGLTRLVILSTRACHPQRSEGPAFGKPRAAVPTGAVEAHARLLVSSAISRTRVCAPHKIRRASLRRGRRGHLQPNTPNPGVSGDSRRLPPRGSYSPPTVKPSMRRVGEATEPRNSRSFAISEMWKNMSFRFPATVISSTG